MPTDMRDPVIRGRGGDGFARLFPDLAARMFAGYPARCPKGSRRGGGFRERRPEFLDREPGINKYCERAVDILTNQGMAPVTLEIEDKFDIPSGYTVPVLTDLPGCAEAAGPAVHRLVALYFDTPDLRQPSTATAPHPPCWWTRPRRAEPTTRRIVEQPAVDRRPRRHPRPPRRPRPV